MHKHIGIPRWSDTNMTYWVFWDSWLEYGLEQTSDKPISVEKFFVLQLRRLLDFKIQIPFLEWNESLLGEDVVLTDIFSVVPTIGDQS